MLVSICVYLWSSHFLYTVCVRLSVLYTITNGCISHCHNLMCRFLPQHPRHRTTLETSSIAELGVVTSGLNGQDISQDDNLGKGQGLRTSRSHRSAVRIPCTDDGGVHVYAHTEDDINTHRDDSDKEVSHTI